jgi:hypothetical protein
MSVSRLQINICGAPPLFMALSPWAFSEVFALDYVAVFVAQPARLGGKVIVAVRHL